MTRCQAERVANAVLAIMATTQSTMMDPREFVPVPIPPTLWPVHTLQVSELLASLGIDFESRSHYSYAQFHPACASLTDRSILPGIDWPEATKALVRFFNDPGLLRGAMYFAASIGVFCFLGDDMIEASGDREKAPLTLLSQVDAETAIWLAYKAVEAILGQLPSDQRKLEHRLILEGFGDFEPGPRGQSAIVLAQELMTFTWDRDKRVAHGSMNPHRGQPITYFEVMDYQYLVSALIRHRAFPGAG
ncbi:MAG: hypothetical protein JXA87_06070 [Thermoleophilia bacterium]|nr:hypothetical protein [Thermoleophilia bacterium]